MSCPTRVRWWGNDLNLTGQPPSTIKRKQAQRRIVIYPKPHSLEQDLAVLKGLALNPAQPEQPTAHRGQERGVRRGASVPSGCFARFPVNCAPVGHSNTRGPAHSSGRTTLGLTVTAVPSLLASGVVFRQRGPSGGGWAGSGLGGLISGTLSCWAS